ncbi:MAG: tyrosine-type recombinase/integrase [Defluviicoccus sp.]|nr:tyrosine-type recombinase/integrase [Defluviicoccus sp.]
MPARERMKLTDAAVARLRARGKEYTVWDSEVSGLGVRVRPTGGKSYVLLRDAGGSSKRVSLGPVITRTVAETRRECHARKAEPEAAETDLQARAVPSLADFVSGEWRVAHFERYKPSSKKTARSLLDGRILPAFGSKPLDRIAPAQARRWFDAFSKTAPGNANNALKLFRQIMNFAVACGHIETDPTRGIRRNRRTPLTRFLSREEIDRLHRVLDRQEGRGETPQADMIRLLLLTGCRKGEIVRLRWSEVGNDALMLEDSKTGPRAVPLNSQAKRVLDEQPRGGSPFVFPSPRDPSRPRCRDIALWYRVRREAGIEDVRLHDLRHTHASHAVMNGVPMPVVSRLLGHADVGMTLRYAHLGDREIEAAAERVGQAVADLIGIGREQSER